MFDGLDTVDFEAVIRALEDAIVVERAYGNDDHARELETDAQVVREALVTAVNATHPAHRDELVFKYESAAAFLKHFGSVFSLNYDLLLYWVSFEVPKLYDGFALGKKHRDGRFQGPLQEAAYCQIFNLHGGLHLFQDKIGDVYKALDHGSGVRATITDEIAKHGNLPLYVAEGNWQAKLKKINSVEYLRHCYRTLKETTANVFVFGHSADQNDSHIYHAIFGSKAKHVWFGIYKPDADNLREFDAKLTAFHAIGGRKVSYSFFEAETAHVWNAE
ncbi:DUF4917 family protein [Fluviibacterium sp. S390]|uniref:DUF4917 family protein n=1 Tax=Fluviibacterium sp. S390 TaxID=3415139 RepID=UPI003C7D3066